MLYITVMLVIRTRYSLYLSILSNKYHHQRLKWYCCHHGVRVRAGTYEQTLGIITSVTCGIRGRYKSDFRLVSALFCLCLVNLISVLQRADPFIDTETEGQPSTRR